MRLLLVLAAAAAGLTSCVAFRTAEPRTATESPDGETHLGLGYLRKKQLVEVEGEFDGGAFRAGRIEIEEPDDEVQVKSTVTSVDPERSELTVGDVTFRLGKKSKVVGPEGEALSLLELQALEHPWAKAEGIPDEDRLRLRKLALRHREQGEAEELQGLIESLERGRRRMIVAGVDVRFEPDVDIVWDVADTPPPPPQDRGLVTRSAGGLRRIQRLDDEDRRPESQLTLGDFLTIGGEVQYEIEWRDNHDLQNGRRRDRLVHEVSGKVELSFDFGPNAFAFAQVNVRRDAIIFDQDRDLEHIDRVRLGEGFVLLTDLPWDGVAIQIGRQDFDHGREWVFDQNLDAVRLFLNFEPVTVELSVSEMLLQPDNRQEGVTNYLAGFHFNELEDVELLVYVLFRKDGSLVDLDRWHIGVTTEIELGVLKLWFDGGYVTGREDGARVEGYGFDLAAMYVFEDTDLEPSVYFGFAYGSGDDEPDDRADNNFRQTGLHDNNDKFNGVTSFRYLGELVRPDLSNIMVFTVGAGVRPLKRTSVDVLLHKYRQVEPAPFLGPSRLRRRPEGIRADLGVELDVVVGLEIWSPLEIEVVLGYFNPGRAFGESPDDAWFMTFQIEYNF